jgi:hypothetical protein
MYAKLIVNDTVSPAIRLIKPDSWIIAAFHHERLHAPRPISSISPIWCSCLTQTSREIDIPFSYCKLITPWMAATLTCVHSSALSRQHLFRTYRIADLQLPARVVCEHAQALCGQARGLQPIPTIIGATATV